MRTRLLAALALLATLGAAGEDALDMHCPKGSVLRERGTDFACETPAGVGEGPFWARRDDGSLRLWGAARGGKPEGRWISWHPSGGKSIEATYRAGELVGPFQMWSETGQLLYAGTHDARGEMDGEWTRWWPNGNRRAQWEMRHGRPHGPVAAWREDGSRNFAGRREDGRREGEWIWWDASGAEIARCRYARDVVVEGTCSPDAP